MGHHMWMCGARAIQYTKPGSRALKKNKIIKQSINTNNSQEWSVLDGSKAIRILNAPLAGRASSHVALVHTKYTK